MGPADGDGRWGALRAVVGDELATWRVAHPRATLTEIEAAVEAALERLRAQYLSAVVGTSAAADPATGEAPDCPACGGPLRPRGSQPREVLTPGQASPIRLRRRYLVCARCEAGVFPPG
jgi:hypothetical protein